MNLVTKTNLLARALCSLAVQVATFLLRLVTGGLSLFVMIVIAGLMLLLWWLFDLERKTAPSSSEDDETTPDYFEGTFDEYVEKLIGDIQDFGGGSREQVLVEALTELYRKYLHTDPPCLKTEVEV